MHEGRNGSVGGGRQGRVGHHFAKDVERYAPRLLFVRDKNASFRSRRFLD
jgi:hypothetical protein